MLEENDPRTNIRLDTMMGLGEHPQIRTDPLLGRTVREVGAKPYEWYGEQLKRLRGKAKALDEVAGVGPPAWRVRVLLDRNEFGQLSDYVDRAVDGLGLALRRTEHAPDWVAGWRRETRRERVARLIVLWLDQMIYEEDTFEGKGEWTLKEAVDGFLARLEKDDPVMDERLSELMGFAQHLPVRGDGVLSLTLSEAATKTREWYAEEFDILRDKASGLKNIERGLSVPEDPAKVETTQALGKTWFGMLGLSLLEFVYVPMSYMP